MLTTSELELRKQQWFVVLPKLKACMHELKHTSDYGDDRSLSQPAAGANFRDIAADEENVFDGSN